MPIRGRAEAQRFSLGHHARHPPPKIARIHPANGKEQGLATIIYLNTVEGDRIHVMTLAGIRRYAAVRGWDVLCADKEPQPFSGQWKVFAACHDGVPHVFLINCQP